MFPPEVLEDLIYVADCSFVTDDNLGAVGDDVKFISRMPATFGVVSKVIKQAWDSDQWVFSGFCASRKEAAEYWVYETVDKVGGKDFRLAVVWSSSMDSRKEKSIRKRIEKAQVAIVKEATELLGREFVCKPDARWASEIFVAKHSQQFHELSFEVVGETIREKRTRRGRPGKDEQPPAERTVCRVSARIERIDEFQVGQARECESCFVLITNLMDAKKHSASGILGEYKQQSTVEARFSFLKGPCLLGQILLKKPSRVEVLGYVLLIALLLATLLERRVRKGIEARVLPS